MMHSGKPDWVTGVHLSGAQHPLEQDMGACRRSGRAGGCSRGAGGTLLTVPLASISGGWCVMVPYVDVSARDTSSGMLRDSPKSATLAVKPLGQVGLPASSTLPARRQPAPASPPSGVAHFLASLRAAAPPQTRLPVQAWPRSGGRVGTWLCARRSR